MEYIDSTTGNHIDARQAGHGGTLVGDQKDFNDGDWIVKFPTNLMGESKRDVFTNDEFKKRFKTTGKKEEKNKLTMAELAKMYPPKIKRRRRK